MPRIEEKRPFTGLRCPSCGAEESLAVRVHDLMLACVECGAHIGDAEVDAMIDSWIRLLKWISAARAFARIDAEENGAAR